jgi:hypothetical protein
MRDSNIPDTGLYVMALQRAAEIVGGTHALAGKLNVRHLRVLYWLNGNAPVPGHIFFLIVEIIERAMLAELQGERAPQDNSHTAVADRSDGNGGEPQGGGDRASLPYSSRGRGDYATASGRRNP